MLQPIRDREGIGEFLEKNTPEGNCNICGKHLIYFFHAKRKLQMSPVPLNGGLAHWNCWYALKRMDSFLRQELITTAKASSLRVHRKTVIFGNVEKIPVRGRNEHGVSRRNPELYRRLVVLQELKMVWRRGYKYYPTHEGWRVYLRLVHKPEDENNEDGLRWEKVFTGALQKRFARPQR